MKDLYSLENSGLLTITNGIEDSQNGIDSLLNGYDLIAIHRSYLIKHGIYNALLEYIKPRNKYLIVFSGGVSQNTVLNKGFQLTVNSSDFYTEKLPSFIEEFCKDEAIKSPLLKYLYGDSWKLTLLLKYRYFLWAYEDIDDMDDEKDESEVDELKHVLWTDNEPETLDEINKEIELEKERIKNL